MGLNLGRGLTWEQSGVKLDNINGGYNMDLLELCQRFKEV
jgi:hypothetical protein